MTNIVFKPVTQNNPVSGQKSWRRPAYISGFPQVQSSKTTGRTALVNIKELDDKFVISAALPGYGKEDISMQLDGNTLKVSGNKVVTNTSKFHLKEFDLTTFERIFTLPEHADSDKIEAITKDGLLTITIHKKEVKKPLQIKIS
ncbi:MAG: Hsp20/alpha crystallin family protein [Saprospiraceae bacterium]